MAENLAEMYTEDATQTNELKGFTKSFQKRGKSKRSEDKNVTELLSFAREKKLILGAKVTQKAFKNNQIQKVFVASNCDEMREKTLRHYAELAGVEVVKLDFDNQELGQKLSKPFLISTVGVRV